MGFSPTGKRRLCTAHAMNRRQPTPSTGQSRATAVLSRELGKVVLDGTADELRDHKDVREFYLGGTGDQRKNLKSFKRRKRWTSSRRKTPRLSKNPMRESQTERTPPTLVRHILVRRVRGRYPRQHLTTMEVGDGSRPPFLQCSVCLGRFRDAIRVAVGYSFA